MKAFLITTVIWMLMKTGTQMAMLLGATFRDSKPNPKGSQLVTTLIYGAFAGWALYLLIGGAGHA